MWLTWFRFKKCSNDPIFQPKSKRSNQSKVRWCWCVQVCSCNESVWGGRGGGPSLWTPPLWATGQNQSSQVRRASLTDFFITPPSLFSVEIHSLFIMLDLNMFQNKFNLKSRKFTDTNVCHGQIKHQSSCYFNPSFRQQRLFCNISGVETSISSFSGKDEALLNPAVCPATAPLMIILNSKIDAVLPIKGED